MYLYLPLLFLLRLLLCCVFQVPVEFVAKEAGRYSQCWDVISSPQMEMAKVSHNIRVQLLAQVNMLNLT